jgi:hypothetical protein
VTLYETLFVVHPEKAPRAKEFIDRFKKIVEVQAVRFPRLTSGVSGISLIGLQSKAKAFTSCFSTGRPRVAWRNWNGTSS